MNNVNPSRKLAALLRTTFAVLIIAGSLATVTPARADNPPTFLFEIDADAASVALDSSNNFYVTSGETVVKFKNNGSYLTQWDGYGRDEVPLDNPYFI